MWLSLLSSSPSGWVILHQLPLPLPGTSGNHQAFVNGMHKIYTTSLKLKVRMIQKDKSAVSHLPRLLSPSRSAAGGLCCSWHVCTSRAQELSRPGVRRWFEMGVLWWCRRPGAVPVPYGRGDGRRRGSTGGSFSKMWCKNSDVFEILVRIRATADLLLNL